MTEARIHRAVSDDGTEIAGRVHGQGPPLVLVPGAMCDGEFHYGPLLTHLTDSFTTFAMSVRNRGLSAVGTDLGPDRLVQDVTAFVDSIGEPVALMGWSQGGALALGAAERSDTVAALATFEPAVVQVLGEEDFTDLGARLVRMGELVQEGRLAEANRTFADWVTNDDELAAMSETGAFFEASGPNVPGFLQEMQQSMAFAGPSPTDPDQLARITAPVLLLQGTRSNPGTWFPDGVAHVAEYVADAVVREIPGAGHLAPYLEPEAVGTELVQFFTEVQQPA